MEKTQKFSLFLLRISLGWLYFYAGITKVLDPAWSAAGYIQGAKTFPGFYQLFLSPDILPIVNFMNAWGLTLLGVSLLLGVFVRLSSSLGIGLMALYYFAILNFPYVGEHSYLVDEHVIYICALLVLVTSRAGRFWGLETWCSELPICKRYPTLRAMLG